MKSWVISLAILLTVSTADRKASCNTYSYDFHLFNLTWDESMFSTINNFINKDEVDCVRHTVSRVHETIYNIDSKLEVNNTTFNSTQAVSIIIIIIIFYD